jgi:hypothetical protein
MSVSNFVSANSIPFALQGSASQTLCPVSTDSTSARDAGLSIIRPAECSMQGRRENSSALQRAYRSLAQGLLQWMRVAAGTCGGAAQSE